MYIYELYMKLTLAEQRKKLQLDELNNDFYKFLVLLRFLSTWMQYCNNLISNYWRGPDLLTLCNLKDCNRSTLCNLKNCIRLKIISQRTDELPWHHGIYVRSRWSSVEARFRIYRFNEVLHLLIGNNLISDD